VSKPTVFIHTNSQQFVGAKVAEYALRKNSRNNEKFDVKILHLDKYPHLTKREGATYLRKGTKVTWRNCDLQSFSPLRFLPPQEMGFTGRAIVIDPDIFALADIYELLSRDMQGKAIWCRRVMRDDGKSSYYNSSCMLMDCAKLTHWRWNERIDQMFRQEWDYGEWIFLRTEAPESIGELEPEWNDFDNLSPRTKMLHNTERSTQPWKTGLPVDYNLNYKSAPPAPKFSLNPKTWVAAAAGRVARRGDNVAVANAAEANERYLQHPDRRQERLFFSLVGECLKTGVFSRDFLRNEIKQKHIRPDSVELAGCAHAEAI
jgi:hypothetical protein